MTSRVLIIAEAGVNHNGSLETALKLVDVAAESGADIVKFQTFDADRIVTAAAPMAGYQTKALGRASSQHEMIRRLQLSKADHAALIDRCAKRRIQFLSTPFDLQSLNMLVDDFHLPLIKFGSGELTNGPLLLAAARTGSRLIVSTGMATLEEVRTALGVIAFGYSGSAERPGTAAFSAAFADRSLRDLLERKVVLLHCTTEYPAPVEEVNLRAMDTLREAFRVPVGYSDHTKGIMVSAAAVARGASVIEKHFTLDRKAEGPDHAASLEPDELNAMVLAIRDIERALGDGRKEPRPSELSNMAVARKSIVASRVIKAGDLFDEKNLTAKRPGTGISPMLWWELLGDKAKRDFTEDEIISN